MLNIQYFILNLITNVLFIIFLISSISLILKKQKVFYISIIILLTLSLPITYKIPLYYLEKPYKKYEIDNTIDLIVILGGGLHHYHNYDEKTTINQRTLERLVFGTYLHKKHSIPILVTGGDVFNIGINEADIMNKIIVERLKGGVKFIENKSKTTEENAKFSSKIFEENNIQKILLVTNSWHLKRSEYFFKMFSPNLEIIPVSGYSYLGDNLNISFKDFIPAMKSFYFHEFILKEYIILFYYKIFI